MLDARTAAEAEIITPIVYRVGEVARLLKISRGAAYRLVGGEELPSIRIGRSVRVLRKDFERYTARKRRASYEPTG